MYQKLWLIRWSINLCDGTLFLSTIPIQAIPHEDMAMRWMNVRYVHTFKNKDIVGVVQKNGSKGGQGRIDGVQNSLQISAPILELDAKCRRVSWTARDSWAVDGAWWGIRLMMWDTTWGVKVSRRPWNYAQTCCPANVDTSVMSDIKCKNLGWAKTCFPANTSI